MGELLWNFIATGVQFYGTDVMFTKLQKLGHKIISMPMTPYQVDSIFAKWENHHMENLKFEKGSSKLGLDQALFTECPSFSSLQLKSGGTCWYVVFCFR